MLTWTWTKLQQKRRRAGLTTGECNTVQQGTWININMRLLVSMTRVKVWEVRHADSNKLSVQF